MAELLRILAVDNEPSVTLSLRYAMAGNGRELTAVSSAAEALAKLDTGGDQFDVVVVDQKMPDMTGLELVRAIKDRGNPVRVIVLSAQLSPETWAAFQDLGVQAILTKPFDLTQMRQAIDPTA